MNAKKLGVFSVRLYGYTDKKNVVDIYRSAMSTEPWFEDLPLEVVEERVRADFVRLESQQFVGLMSGEICSTMWWDQTNAELLKKERGEEVVANWQKITSEDKTVWFRDLLVSQGYQGKGVGTQMLDFAIQEWKNQKYHYALLRVHLGGAEKTDIPSNIKAIKLYQKKGFVLLPNVFHVSQLSHDKDHNKVNMGYMILSI